MSGGIFMAAKMRKSPKRGEGADRAPIGAFKLPLRDDFLRAFAAKSSALVLGRARPLGAPWGCAHGHSFAAGPAVPPYRGAAPASGGANP